MRFLRQLQVLDRMNGARVRSVPVITVRPVTRAENEAKTALREDARTHIGRIARPVA